MSSIYINEQINKDFALFTLNRCGNGRVMNDFCIERDEAYPFCNIHYINKGKMMVEFRNRTFSVGEGQLFILPPFEAHKYWDDNSGGLELSWLEFSGGATAELVGSIIEIGQPIFFLPEGKRINAYINRMKAMLEKQRLSNYAVSKIIYSILINLMEQNNNNSIATIHINEKNALYKVTQYIEKNLSGELGIKELSQVANYSQSYFSKLFIKLYGITPSKYVLERRILKAKELLCKHNEKVDVIAQLLGFYDTSHFVRVFKKAEGTTPAEFRKHSMLYV